MDRKETEVDHILLQNALALSLEYHKETTAYGAAAVRNASLLNGGALIALLAFVQNLMANGRSFDNDSLIQAAISFALGTVLGLFAAALAYFAHLGGTQRAFYDAISPVVYEKGGFTGHARRIIDAPAVSDQRRSAAELDPNAYLADLRKTAHQKALKQRAIIWLVLSSFFCFGVGLWLSFFLVVNSVDINSQPTKQTSEYLGTSSTKPTPSTAETLYPPNSDPKLSIGQAHSSVARTEGEKPPPVVEQQRDPNQANSGPPQQQEIQIKPSASASPKTGGNQSPSAPTKTTSGGLQPVTPNHPDTPLVFQDQ